METDDLKTLQNLTNALSNTSSAVNAVRIEDPLVAVEESFSSFTKHSFDIVKKGYEFEEFIQEALQARMPEADFSQLMNLYNMVHRSNTTRSEALMNPLTSIAISERSVEAASRSAVEGKLQDTLYQSASKDVLQGVVQLTMVLERLSDLNKGINQNPQVVDKKE